VVEEGRKKSGLGGSILGRTPEPGERVEEVEEETAGNNSN
jgi:hypothetical protein